MDSSMSLQRWQQAFEDHPISTTRTIEKQLRAGVANNRERLRGVVGGNYRELLSTADQIVSLGSKSRTTEVQISDLGRLCEPPPHRPSHVESTDQDRTIAELWLLQRCIDATRASAGRADLVRAAQFLIISRLLSKSLHDRQHVPASLPVLQGRITALRRHTILRIENVLSSPRSSSALMVKAACAYCLITSASPSDAFKYAQRLRLDKLRRILEVEQTPADFAVGILRYILSTSQILKRAFARALTDALSTVQRRPILLDLNLAAPEVFGSVAVLTLVSDDIRSFSPYSKREPVSAADFASSLHEWTTSACDTLGAALRHQLSEISDMSEVLRLRHQLYSSLLPVYFSSVSCTTIHKTIQQHLLEHIEALVRTRASDLEAIAGDFVKCDTSQIQTPDLWKREVATMSLRGGGTAFLEHVHKRHNGTGSEMLNTSRALKKWTMSVRQMLAGFENIRSTRWRDLLEEPDDDQEDEAADVTQTLLDGDPAQFSSSAGSSLQSAVTAFGAKVLKAALKCVEDAEGHDVGVAVYYLRVIRLTLKPLREAFPEEAILDNLRSAVPQLQQLIAEKVTATVLKSFDKSSIQQLSAAPDADHLPSPTTFKLLRELCVAMAEVGGNDVWSQAAVASLKSTLGEKVFTTDSGFIRTSFDQAYLGCALASTRSALPPEPSAEELKAAQDYWSRTKLLFGVLAE